MLNLGEGALRTLGLVRPRKVTAVMGVPAPHSPIPPSPVSFPLAHKHTLFPSLKHVKQHPFLDSAPPFGCHLVSLLPFQTMFPETVSANSFLSACHLAFTPPPQGTCSSARLHRTSHCRDPSTSWLLDPSGLASACLLTFLLSFHLVSISHG